MKQARQRSSDRTEQALIDWSIWVPSYHDAQGWGGGAERDIVTNNVYGRPSSGSGADPVFNELVATLAAGQGPSQRVHSHLVRYSREINRDWFRVVWARFVGQEIEVPHTLRGPKALKAEVVVTRRWSGLQCWDDVVAQTGIPERTAKAMLSQVKRMLAQDLRMDDVMRRKHPGLTPTRVEADELARIEAAQALAGEEERYARAA